MAESKRRDDERVRLKREVAMIDPVLSAMSHDDLGKGVRLERKKRSQVKS